MPNKPCLHGTLNDTPQGPCPECRAENKAIADTILQQLGDRQFVIMSGARNFTFAISNLRFNLPIGPYKVVDVALEDSDLYTIRFWKTAGPRFKRGGMSVAEFDIAWARWRDSATVVTDVYCDGLADAVAKATGLVLRMPRVTFAGRDMA